MRTADKMAATRENCTALAPAVPKLSLHLSVAQLQLLVFWKKCIKRILTYNLNLEYLKIRICWGGGGKIWPSPPSNSHVWCPNMPNDTSLESSYALLLESAKKCKFAKFEIFWNIHLIKCLQKMSKKG